MFFNKVDTCHGVAHEVEVKQVIIVMLPPRNEVTEMYCFELLVMHGPNLKSRVDFFDCVFPHLYERTSMCFWHNKRRGDFENDNYNVQPSGLTQIENVYMFFPQHLADNVQLNL